ncbi:hypothetical protein Tco_0524087 [Tanacetum coccineum]
MKKQDYNIIKTKDLRTQRQSNLKKFKEARFKISPQEFKDHTSGEIVSLKYVYEHGSSESARYLLKETSLRGRLIGALKVFLLSIVTVMNDNTLHVDAGLGCSSYVVHEDDWKSMAIGSTMLDTRIKFEYLEQLLVFIDQQGVWLGALWCMVWKSVRYGISKGLDTAYWGFLGVGTTFDIFQNIHILYFQYGVLTFSGYGVLIYFHLWFLVSAGTDTPYLP